MQDVGKPKWAEDEALRKRHDAHRSAEGNRALIEPRLDAGTIDNFDADIGFLSSSDAD